MAEKWQACKVIFHPREIKIDTMFDTDRIHKDKANELEEKEVKMKIKTNKIYSHSHWDIHPSNMKQKFVAAFFLSFFLFCLFLYKISKIYKAFSIVALRSASTLPQKSLSNGGTSDFHTLLKKLDLATVSTKENYGFPRMTSRPRVHSFVGT